MVWIKNIFNIIAVASLIIFSLFLDCPDLTTASGIIWPSECFDFYSFIPISVLHNFSLLRFLILFFCLPIFISTFFDLFVHFNNFQAKEMEIEQVLDSNLMMVLVFFIGSALPLSFFLILQDFSFELIY